MKLSLQDLIRLFLIERSPLSTHELAIICDVSDRQIRREIRKMPDVQQERSGRNVRYSLMMTGCSLPPRPPFPAANTAARSGPQGGSIPESRPNDENEGSAPSVGGVQQRTGESTLSPYPEAEGAPIGDSLPMTTGRSAHSGKGCASSGKPAADVAPIGRGPCPLSGMTMEHDTIRFLVRDPTFRRAVFAMADQCKWEVKKVDNGTTFSAHHIKFFSGVTATAVFSDEPALMRPYADQLTVTFGHDSDAGFIATYLRLEEPSHLIYDEWTTVIDDMPIIQGVMKAMYPLVRVDGTYRRSGPDLQTPGLKIYARGGTIRIETIATNQLQQDMAYRFHDELHRVLRTIPKDPQALLRLITRWYEGGNACPGLDCLLESLHKLDFLNTEEIITLMQKHLGIPAEASAVFLAAYGLWASKKFKAAVRPDDIIQMLSAEDIALTNGGWLQ